MNDFKIKSKTLKYEDISKYDLNKIQTKQALIKIC